MCVLIDSTNRSVSSAPKPPPRRQNPFNRPANEFIRPAPPIPANTNTNNSKTQGKYIIWLIIFNSNIDKSIINIWLHYIKHMNIFLLCELIN